VTQKYTKITEKLKAAWKSGDMKAYRRAKKQLEKWQREYGAYEPIR